MLSVVEWADNVLNIICKNKADNCLKIEFTQYKQKAKALMIETCCSELRYWNLDFDYNSETLKIENRTQLETASSRKADDS